MDNKKRKKIETANLNPELVIEMISWCAHLPKEIGMSRDQEVIISFCLGGKNLAHKIAATEPCHLTQSSCK